LPYLAVAGGAYIFVYKHLKGTFKFLIPNVDPNPEELQVWADLKEAKIEMKDAINKLIELKTNCKFTLNSINYIIIKFNLQNIKVKIFSIVKFKQLKNKFYFIFYFKKQI
jgi:hypothetical protein